LLRDGQALVATGPIDVLTDLAGQFRDPGFPRCNANGCGRHPTKRAGPAGRTVVDAAGVKLWQLLDGEDPCSCRRPRLARQIPAREALGKARELELKGRSYRGLGILPAPLSYSTH